MSVDRRAVLVGAASCAVAAAVPAVGCDPCPTVTVAELLPSSEMVIKEWFEFARREIEAVMCVPEEYLT